jgi:hypothetical protein
MWCSVSEDQEIYCHIRFSFFGLTDTRLRPEDHDAAQALLYDETRMARRFFLFENLTLPSLRAQTDRGFKIVIMSSDIMPQRFQDRLRAITAQDGNVTLDFSARRNGIFAFRKHIDGSLGEGLAQTAVHFRLDDDDALCTDFIARLRQVSKGLAQSTHITFPLGLTVIPKAAGSDEGAVLPIRQLLHSVGLAIICGDKFRKNPFQMMHGNVWQRWPVVSDPSFPSFIRAHHFDNDTLENQDKILKGYRQSLAGPEAAAVGIRVDAMLAQGFSFTDQTTLANLLGQLKQITGLHDLPAV